MHFQSAALLAAALVAQRVVAGGWNDASAFSCPGNTNNHCSRQQQHGYDWSNLQTGSFSSYGSNKFSGFTCADSFGKRDVLSKRGFQGKCITGNLDDSPSMSGDAFSIDQMQISSSHDTEIEAHYGMPDGSTCKEVHSCSTQGTTFQNTQCGGAKQVTFKPGKGAPKGCSIGVHSVGFHCGAPSKPPNSPSTSVSVESSPPSTPPTSSTPTPPTYSKSTPAVYHGSSSTPVAPISSSAPAPPCYGSGCSTSVLPTSSAPPPPGCYGKDCSTTPVAPVSSSAPAPPCYGDSCAPSSPPAYSSPMPPTYSAPPPPPYQGSSSTPVAPVSSSAPPPPGCYGSGCSSSPAAPVSSPPPSYQPPPPPQCPEVLPRCLKTWMFVTSCENNSDHSCFCGNEKFIKNVMSCLSAWGASQSEVQAAVSYLTGICAASVPNNPAIITACPPEVTPAPPAPAASMPVPSPPAPAGQTPPCTTITYSGSTVTVPVVSHPSI